MAFAPDGRRVAGTTYRAWVLMSVADGQTVVRREVESPIAALAFTPDGRRLLTAHDDGSALVWDLPAIAAAKLPETWWADLAGDDASRAYAAVEGVAAAGDRGLALVAERLRPAEALRPPPTEEQLQRLIAKLDANAFADRESADKELQAWGEISEPALARALDEGPSVEARRRIERLLERLAVPGPEERRGARTVWALERIGTPAARRDWSAWPAAPG